MQLAEVGMVEQMNERVVQNQPPLRQWLGSRCASQGRLQMHPS